MIKKILVSQPKPASDKSPYYELEKDFGIECVFRPFFKVEGLTAKEFRQQKINLLDYTAVVLPLVMQWITISSWPRKCVLLFQKT